RRPNLVRRERAGRGRGRRSRRCRRGRRGRRGGGASLHQPGDLDHQDGEEHRSADAQDDLVALRLRPGLGLFTLPPVERSGRDGHQPALAAGAAAAAVAGVVGEGTGADGANVDAFISTVAESFPAALPFETFTDWTSKSRPVATILPDLLTWTCVRS